ncbi:MAG: sulfur carrier protein ThiS [Microbacteriaceae bacterium]|nr:sulfur carrier protein ThiS [Microbacteriaceae bacterium]
MPEPTITLNGMPRDISPGETVTDLVSQLAGRSVDASGLAADGSRLGVAVACNSAIVPRSQWSVTALETGDQFEIVTAVQGG